MKNLNDKVVIIGAGISGCTLANILAKKGHQVEIYEKNNFIGGMCYDFLDEKGILIHKFGPHIFHTDKKDVWEFVNQFDKFNGYINQVLVEVDNKLIEMPINFNSIKELTSKKEFEDFVNEVNSTFKEESVSIFDLKTKITSPESIKIIDFIYKNVYENYTTKMWGIKPEDIDPEVLRRVKINLNYSWNYFPNDPYQGLPINGYTYLLEEMIKHPNIKVYKNVDASQFIDFKDDCILFKNEKHKIVYTGQIDKLFDFEFGKLTYRSLNILFETFNQTWFQKIGVINYPAHKSITRITEYKYLTKQNKNDWTTISTEIPGEYDEESFDFNIPFYPINNFMNNELLLKYQEKVLKIKNLFLLGRLANFKYYDMDDAIEQALLFKLNK
ncbi:MAG: UDP-galactopyranose mutase [Mycoplasma sp.]